MPHLTRTAVNSWLITLAALLSTANVAAGNSPMQVGRYSIIAPVATAAQSDPLQTMVQIHFPAPHISTVGDAMRYLLRHSSYNPVTTFPTSRGTTDVKLTLEFPKAEKR